MGCWPIVMERGYSEKKKKKKKKKIGMRDGAGGLGNKVIVLFRL